MNVFKANREWDRTGLRSRQGWARRDVRKAGNEGLKAEGLKAETEKAEGWKGEGLKAEGLKAEGWKLDDDGLSRWNLV